MRIKYAWVLLVGLLAYDSGGVTNTAFFKKEMSKHDEFIAKIKMIPIDTKEVIIGFSGDILAHPSLVKRASVQKGYDFNEELSGLTEILTADINICHMETPLTDLAPQGYPIFSIPSELATSLKKVGFDGCSTASNHSLDMGSAGVFSTINTFRKLGMQTAGTRTNAEDAGRGMFEINGITVAHLAYTFSTNGIMLPKDKSWIINLLEARAIIKDALAAKKIADIVIVSIHWGTEYSQTPNSQQKELAKSITASGAVDAIIGHHAHVLQSAELVNGKPVFYGLGNLWSGQGPWSDMRAGNLGTVVTIKFQVESGNVWATNITVQPTIVIPGTWKVVAAYRAAPAWYKTACLSIQNNRKLFAGIGQLTEDAKSFATTYC
jgi:poly-gamma-glutamate synthesis protein (capsule biosynthesis protein)